VTLTVSATATDTAGPITQVAFYNGSTLIGTVTQAPYSITLPSIAAGSYSITAQASDNLGNAQTSAPVTVTVNAPINVSVTSPVNGTQVSGHNLTLSAAASTTGASITQIAYYNGTTLIATATQAPFNVIFPDLEAGTYSFMAQATDSAGVVATSAPVTVTVTAAAGGASGGTGTAELVYDIQSDQIGTPRMVTDQSGNVVWRWDNTDPFGDNMPNQSPNGTTSQFVFNLRFPGQYFDLETGTYYNYFRDYDSVTGRYLESDLIGLLGKQFSTYAYVGGNPLQYSDPLGLYTVDWTAATFAQSAHPPTWVVTLRQLGYRLQDRINREKNPTERARLQCHFDQWIVKRTSRDKDPDTNYKDQTTEFSPVFFELGDNYLNPFAKGNMDQYAVFLHEFGHLMPENEALDPGKNAYFIARLNGTTSSLAIEQDADRFALRLFHNP
jgi:RHS repeat-associated protein